MKPNILFIVIDCLRSDFVYQSGLSYTPTIDKLRQKGFSFLNTYASTATTTPNFAALLTGLYPFENGVRTHHGHSLPGGITTLPQILQQNGYHTYAEMTGPVGPEIGLGRGFNEYNFRVNTETVHTDFGSRFINKFQHHYLTPWFVLLHIWPLHIPRRVTKSCRSRKYGSSEYGRALASIDKYLVKLLSVMDADTLICLTGDHGEFYTTSLLDWWYRALPRKWLERKQNRVEMPTHISHYMRPYWIGHGISCFEGMVKIPLTFVHPRIKPGQSSAQTRQIDTLPTLMDIAGIECPVSITGRSRLPVINRTDETNLDAYLEAVCPQIPENQGWLSAIMVDNRYKYILPWNSRFPEELYDVQHDPGEICNLAAKHPDIAGELKQKIENMNVRQMVGVEMGKEDTEIVEDRLRSLGYL